LREHSGPRSGAKNDRVHDPPWNERKQPGNDERAGENPDHDPPMIDDAMPMREPHAERKHDQRENRQQMDRAPGTPEFDLVDPERTQRDRQIRTTQIQPIVL